MISNSKIIEKIYMDFKKSTNLLEIKKYNFFDQFVSTFSKLLLCNINVLEIFNIVDSLWIFVRSRRTEIQIELNCWL